MEMKLQAINGEPVKVIRDIDETIEAEKRMLELDSMMDQRVNHTPGTIE